MRDDNLYLLHILESIQWIETYAEEGRDAFLNDRKTQDAILRNLQVMGQSVKNLSPTLTDAYPNLPWRDIGDFRNVLVHEYLGLNLDRVWNVIEQNLPWFRDQVETILNEKGIHPPD